MTTDILDSASIAARADQAAQKIRRAGVAVPFKRRAYEYLRGDARNFRQATTAEIENGPPWAKAKAARGEQIDVFAPCRASMARVRRVARYLEDTCAELDHLSSTSDQLSEREVLLRALMNEFVSRISRRDFMSMELKARYFAREHKNRVDTERASERFCHDEEVFSSPGRVWGRVASVAEMWNVGKEFRNCLARGSGHCLGFARDLRSGRAQLWVLRDHDGKGIIVVLAWPNDMRVSDYRGFRNASVSSNDPDLAMLLAARGWRTAEHDIARFVVRADGHDEERLLAALRRIADPADRA